MSCSRSLARDALVRRKYQGRRHRRQRSPLARRSPARAATSPGSESTCRTRCGEWWRSAMSIAAATYRLAGSVAGRGRFWSWITNGRGPRAETTRSRTCDCCAELTISFWQSGSLASGCLGRWGSGYHLELAASRGWCSESESAARRRDVPGGASAGRCRRNGDQRALSGSNTGRAACAMMAPLCAEAYLGPGPDCWSSPC